MTCWWIKATIESSEPEYRAMHILVSTWSASCVPCGIGLSTSPESLPLNTDSSNYTAPRRFHTLKSHFCPLGNRVQLPIRRRGQWVAAGTKVMTDVYNIFKCPLQF